MKNFTSLLVLLLCASFVFAQNDSEKEKIETLLDNWHQAAAEANFDDYFSYMTSDAVFIGTDATENWTVEEFKAYAKPYFDAGKAWSFSSVEKNIYRNGKMAWFDELLQTQMGICRGSGVLVKENNQWKIKHYVLSISIPNENVTEVTSAKEKFDREFLQQLKNKP